MSDLDLLAAAGKLKSVKRQGWLDAGVPRERAESVADHSFRVAFMVAFLAPRADRGKSGRTQQMGLDVLKTVRMALVHDLAESAVGDLTPRSGISRIKKARMEGEVVRRFGDREVLSLWKEYEDGSSPEARLVRQADVLERVIQAKEYAAKGTGGDLARFWKGWRKQITSPRLLALMD